MIIHSKVQLFKVLHLKQILVWEYMKLNKEAEGSGRVSAPGEKTFLQFKLNNGKVLNDSFVLEATTVQDLKDKLFK